MSFLRSTQIILDVCQYYNRETVKGKIIPIRSKQLMSSVTAFGGVKKLYLWDNIPCEMNLVSL